MMLLLPSLLGPGLVGRMLGGLLIIHLLGDAHGLGFAVQPFFGPAVARVLLVHIVVGAPVVVLLLLVGPGLTLGLDLAPALHPVGLGHGLAPFPPRRGEDIGRPREVTAGEVRALVHVVGRHRPSVAVIDLHQLAPVEAIGIIRVADQERILVAWLVIVVPLAAGQLFDHLIGPRIAPPHPGPLAAVIEGVIGRRVAEGVAHVVGEVGVGVALVWIGQMHDSRTGRRRQILDQGTRCAGRGGCGGQGQGGLGRRHLREGVLLAALAAAGDRQGEQAGGKAQAQGQGPMRDLLHLRQTPFAKLWFHRPYPISFVMRPTWTRRSAWRHLAGPFLGIDHRQRAGGA